ncbi:MULTISPECIES: PH domain-containing protein [Nocardioides]|uniref:PH domain-containing protein n=1 Tax=Nocardioides vastitatis TaxID=2568655 RepID=A0ABW0ZEU4_9ACTN|nr:PH domain-containing protein [Nocardioides sp.]THJ04638.1 hypothetical protein E7Z54_08145 [Nocardioides sp.]
MTWQRLDRRMLLVHPIKEIGRFLPVLIGVLVAGGASGAGPWSLLGVIVPVALGVVRYLTTTWRIAEGRVELRRGLLQRHTLSTSVDRVRTVDLTASPVHRLLGLATVVIGTGSVASDANERLELDALPSEQAAALRTDLLWSRAVAAAAAVDEDAPADSAAEEVLARFSARWLWYAPFSSAGLVAAGAAVGGALQLTEIVDIRLTEDALAAVAGAFVGLLLGAALLLAALLAVAGYLVTNGGFVLARQGAAWHVRRGLLTRRETSIDTARLAGISLGEPAALRIARGRRLAAIVTGLPGASARSAVLLPPAPTSTVVPAAVTILGSAGPVTGPLLRHGRTATVRRYSRAILAVLPVVLGLAAAALSASYWLLAAVPIVLGLAVLLAHDRARSLGHAFSEGHVVMRSGSVVRSRDALAAGHVIGWNLHDTWFQRRSGLVTVAATTAGGSGRVQVYDVTTAAALALAEAATPGLVGQFTDPDDPAPSPF